MIILWLWESDFAAQSQNDEREEIRDVCKAVVVAPDTLYSQIPNKRERRSEDEN